MTRNSVATPTDSLMPGTCVWAVRMHPLYDAVCEVREVSSGRFELYHHYGEGSIPWRDDTASPALRKEDAIETVRTYQKAFLGN